MGQEIELKIPLSDEKYNEIYAHFIAEESSYPGILICNVQKEEVVKCDEYFTRYDTIEERKAHNEPSVIRLRREDDKEYFCLKRKTYVNGIEQNKEYETFIEDSGALREFFIEAGYHRWFYKEKSAVGAHCKMEGCEYLFHPELVCVNGMKYIEVEVTAESGDADKISDALETFVKKMGLNPEEKDPRSWYEIING